MFKKGQLVKTAYGFSGVVEKESTVYPGSYIVRYLGRDGLSTAYYYRPYEITLIGNNFKFKGVK